LRLRAERAGIDTDPKVGRVRKNLERENNGGEERKKDAELARVRGEKKNVIGHDRAQTECANGSWGGGKQEKKADNLGEERTWVNGHGTGMGRRQRKKRGGNVRKKSYR